MPIDNRFLRRAQPFLKRDPKDDNRVLNTVDISGITDVAATTLAPYTESVFTDNVAPTVISGSISSGAIVGPGALTDVVTFSEPMNTGLTTASGIDLRGLLLAVNYAPASFSWDATGTILTVNCSALPVDDYTETLVASDFADIVGLNLTSNLSSTSARARTGLARRYQPCPSRRA